MFLHNANWLRRATIVLLVMVVTLAGLWPLVSRQAARDLEIFQRYSGIMTFAQALDLTFQAEFCGDAPAPEKQTEDWQAQSNGHDGKLIILAQAPTMPPALETNHERPLPDTKPGLWSAGPATPPPRA